MRSSATGKFSLRLVSTVVVVVTSMIPFKLCQWPWPVEIQSNPATIPGATECAHCTSCAFLAKSALSVRTGSGSGTATEKAPGVAAFSAGRRRRMHRQPVRAPPARRRGRRVRPRGVTGNRELPCHSEPLKLEVNFKLKARGREHRPGSMESAMDRAPSDSSSESSGGARDHRGA